MKTLFGTQVYPWHQYYKAEGKDWKDHLPEILDQVKTAGLEYWEQMIESQSEADRLAVLLEYRGLRMESTYVGGLFHREDYESGVEKALAQAKWAKSLGARFVVCNPNPISWSDPQGKNDEELGRQANALSLLGEGLKQEGMELSYHVHAPELRHAAREFHHMMLNVSPDVMGLCLETHWLYRGSGDSNAAVLDIMKLYGERINTTHLRQSTLSIWDQSFGEGDVDNLKIFEGLKRLNYEGPLTFELAFEKETQRTMSAAEAHQEAKAYLSSLLARV